MTLDFTASTKELIDNLKGICANNGLGNDGNEFKIITQVFLYKFMNDKFGYEVKELDLKLKASTNWEKDIAKYSDKDYEKLILRMSPDSAKLKREHFLSYLHNRQNESEFAKLFDDTLRDIAIFNNDIFSVKTEEGTKITLFDELSNYVTGSAKKKDDFCKALVNQLVNFSFEKIFSQKFDFFSTIFEYLIKDYNKDGGGKYAEYYTPHAVSKIMASILVDKKVSNVTCYDPAAGSGTLLMNLAHAIGEDRCTIYSQDISQKSSSMLRLNLILNNLVHSIQNIIQGNTLLTPYHKNGESLATFDYIVSNPPFKLDFSDWRNDLDTKQNSNRFFAGIPNIPKKDVDTMAIYLLFIQHIIFSLSDKGKAAIVVPTGFITANSGIEKKIREHLITNKMLRGVVSMPSNIFATTGTNVSVLFLDKPNSKGDIVLMDASKLGTTVKDGKNQRTVLSKNEEDLIINTFLSHETVNNFSIVVSHDKIIKKSYSLSPAQYFTIENKYIELSPLEFREKITKYNNDLNNLFSLKNVIESIGKLIFDYWFIQFDFPTKEKQPYKTSGGQMVWNDDVNKYIPKGWNVINLGTILDTCLGGTPDTKNNEYWLNGQIPWISSGEVDNFPVLNTNNFITQSGLSNSPAVLLPKGSVLVSIVRYIRISILGIDAATNQSVVGIKENDEIKKNYIYPFMVTQVPVLMSKRAGAQQPHINKGEIDSIPIIIPSDEVLNRYYKLTDSIYQALANDHLDQSDLSNLKQYTIKALID